MSWRLAKSIAKLREEVDAQWPQRDRRSDGTIGDDAHAASTSDHNPFVSVGGVGVVRAIDITHDPSGRGPSAQALANWFAQLAREGDSRVRYIIWNREIYNPGIAQRWRPYSGSNPHTKHVHLSVSLTPRHFDSNRKWLTNDTGEDGTMFCRQGDEGQHVKSLQLALKDLGTYDGEIDGDFGPGTANALGQHVGGAGKNYGPWEHRSLQAQLHEHWERTIDPQGVGDLRKNVWSAINDLRDEHAEKGTP